MAVLHITQQHTGLHPPEVYDTGTYTDSWLDRLESPARLDAGHGKEQQAYGTRTADISRNRNDKRIRRVRTPIQAPLCSCPVSPEHPVLQHFAQALSSRSGILRRSRWGVAHHSIML